METNIIGEKIREIRKEEMHITQEELAARTGIKHVTICRYEKGHSTPDPYNLNALAKALDCDVSYLDGTSDYRKRTTADIAEQAPLSEVTICLLRELKEECDIRFDDGHDYLNDEELLTAFLADCILAHVIASQSIGGINETLLLYTHRIAELKKVLYEYGSDYTGRDERYYVTKNDLEYAERMIGKLFSEVVSEQMGFYVSSGIKLTDNINLGYQKARREDDIDGK